MSTKKREDWFVVCSVGMDEVKPEFGVGPEAYEQKVYWLAERRGLNPKKACGIHLNPVQRRQEFLQKKRVDSMGNAL